MKVANLRQMPDRDVVVSRLWTALQAVRDPGTYADTGEPDLARHRAALAERAKAMTGLMLFMLEGLVQARVRFRDKGICHVPSMVHAAWLRYLQLHGRQATIVVPMDGWLVLALPDAVMTKDEQVLGVLAASIALGDAQPASDISLPSGLVLPAELFGELIDTSDLAADVGRLLGARRVFPADGASGPVSALTSQVATQLITDFVHALSPSPH